MATTVVEMSSDEQKLLRGLQKIIDQDSKMRQGFEKTGRASQRSTAQAVRLHGDQATAIGKATAGIQKMATQYVTLSAGVGLVSDALRFMTDEANKAKGSFDLLETSTKRLAQVADGPADLGASLARRDRLAKEFAVPRQDVADLLFTAKSEGLSTADVRSVLRGSAAFNVKESASVAGQLPGLFKGSGLTGSQAVNLVATASKESRADFSAIARSFAQAAEGASQAGSSPSETGALLSVLTGKFSSPESAAARIKAIGSRLALEGDSGGIVAGVQRLQKMSTADREGFLGSSQELNSAFARISESLDAIAELEQRIEASVALTGTAGSPLNQAVASRLNNPQTGAIERAQLERRRAAISREVSMDRMAGGAFTRESVVDAFMSEDNVRRHIGPKRYIDNKLGQFATMMNLGPSATEGLLRFNDAPAALVENVLTSLAGAVGELRGAAKDLRSGAEMSNQAGATLLRGATDSARVGLVDRQMQRSAE